MNDVTEEDIMKELAKPAAEVRMHYPLGIDAPPALFLQPLDGLSEDSVGELLFTQAYVSAIRERIAELEAKLALVREQRDNELRTNAELAAREAQPVAELVYSSALPRFIGDTNEVEGYRCWIHGETRLVPTMEQAYADAKAVCTALPAAAAPETNK